MAELENVSHLTREQLVADLELMDDGHLQAQEITQKAALHCLLELRKVGVTEENVEAFLRSLRGLADLITREIQRRGLASITIAGDQQPS